jgi:hypothetical protein
MPTDSGTATYLEAVGIALESEMDADPNALIISEAHDAIAIHPMDIIVQINDHRDFHGSTASKSLPHPRNTLPARDCTAELD